MTDNYINVTVTSKENKRVTVSTQEPGFEVTATTDTGKFWAQTAENWATSDTIVENKDYSSKYYANKAKVNAENARVYEASVKETYNTFVEESGNIANEVRNAGQESVNSIESSRVNAVDSINTVKNEVVDSINSTKTNILKDIEFVADGEKEEIQELADKAKDDIESTGFYMQDDKLYFINSKGEEEEFKSGGSGLVMFDTILKDHVLTYKESKGLALQGTYVYKDAIAGSRYGYPDFYNKVLEEYSEAVNTETVNNVKIRVHSNGHKFYNTDDKEAIDEFFNTMGTAWFYGLDTENERVFLPRNNWFEQATTDESEVGNFVEAGLPNITGAVSSWTTGALSDDSALYAYNGKGTYIGGGMSANGLAFDASLSSSIYGKSDTVQPNAVKKLLYICVGNTESQSSVTNVIDVTTTENDTTPLFTGMYFDFTPNNVSWLKAGRTVDGADIYAFVYNELVNVLNGETKYGDLKVVDMANMISGVDYSEYWKVNQDEMYFVTPTTISNKALSGAVKGNGLTLGLTNGGANGGLGANTSNGYLGAYSDKYGVDVGIATSTSVITNTLGITTDPTKSGIIAEQSTAQLYFKVANAVQNLELLDVGTVMEQAVLRSSLTEAQVVVETYQNGTSWYRIWSDGWCEQGGSTDKGTKIAITLLKQYKDNSYQILIGQYHTGATDMHGTVIRDSKAPTGFTIAGNANVNFNWQASGYLW